MSEPKLISPMLDEFDMGGPISDHDGVRCCPAMRKNSDDKYIVKVISVPASSTKMDALLLTGAYPDRQSALAYFKERANEIVAEKKVLDSLAQLEGFVAFEDCQVVPMDDESGYDVYLLGEYRQTLERFCARNPVTQLAAVNLGLDLCTALSVCRRSGYMCIDLKPSNIFIVGDHEFRIGDLGFVKLSSLKYASVPDMYRSCYTAPEAEDAFAPLNDSMDIYAVGLILYKIYNGGELPFSGDHAPSEKFAPPAYADSEMAEIILKACDPDPLERWQDPVQMGQAIVNYMQKNGANDTPLVVEKPAAQEEVPEAEAAEADAEENIDEILEVLDEEEAELPVVEEPADEVSVEETPVVLDDPAEVIIDEISAAIDEDIQPEEAAPSEQAAEAEEPEAAEEVAGATEAEDSEYDNLSFLDGWVPEDAEEAALEAQDYDGASDDINDIINQIDALTAHEVPDPVVAPDPIEIKIPDPIVEEEMDIAEEIAEEVEETIAASDAVEEELPEEEQPYIPKKKRTGLIICVVLAILAALAAGAYFFYTLYYLQPIHAFNVTGSEDTLQVELVADVDEALLTVVCADSHGNKVSAPVVGGKAVFSGLAADTAYTVSLEIDGFHELTGTTSKVYSTPVQTKVTQLQAITGSEDGSVILSFAVEGPDSEQWNVIYNAADEAERVTAFPSHMVTLAGLTVGKEYTFRIEPIDDIYLAGDVEIVYTARNLVCAEDLHVTACVDGQLSAQWNTPEGEEVSEWIVRCYNESGYDETLTTTDNEITFENVDDAVANSIEVTAANMSVSQRVLVPANSVTISEFSVDTANPAALNVSWSANRDIPADGWSVRYTVTGIAAPAPITSTENTVQIPAVPGGEYVFTITDGAGNPVLGGPFTHKQPDTTAFDAYSVNQSNITVRLCKTPETSGWSYSDLEDEDYVNAFTAGQGISAVLALSERGDDSEDSVLITFAIYDEMGNLIGYSHDSQIWEAMWHQNYCELDIPGVPAEAGTYNVIIYFNGTEAGSQKFEITA